MNIADFLSPTDVMIDVAAADKQKLLSELARKAAAIIDVPPEHILAELFKREELGSTGVGGGVALPHARFQQIAKPFGMFVRLRKPIAFDAVDGQAGRHRLSAPASGRFRRRAARRAGLYRAQAQEPGDHGRIASGPRQRGNVSHPGRRVNGRTQNTRLELQKIEPDLHKISAWMQRYFYAVATQGMMQVVVMIIIMTRFRAGI